MQPAEIDKAVAAGVGRGWGGAGPVRGGPEAASPGPGGVEQLSKALVARGRGRDAVGMAVAGPRGAAAAARRARAPGRGRGRGRVCGRRPARAAARGRRGGRGPRTPRRARPGRGWARRRPGRAAGVGRRPTRRTRGAATDLAWPRAPAAGWHPESSGGGGCGAGLAVAVQDSRAAAGSGQVEDAVGLPRPVLLSGRPRRVRRTSRRSRPGTGRRTPAPGVEFDAHPPPAVTAPGVNSCWAGSQSLKSPTTAIAPPACSGAGSITKLITAEPGSGPCPASLRSTGRLPLADQPGTTGPEHLYPKSQYQRIDRETPRGCRR